MRRGKGKVVLCKQWPRCACIVQGRLNRIGECGDGKLVVPKWIVRKVTK